MTNARNSLQELRDRAGGAYDSERQTVDLPVVEKRVARQRAARAAGAVVGGLAILLAVGVAVINAPWGAEPAPAQSPSDTPEASPSVNDAWPAWCSPASVVPGKPVGDLGGLEGWFNSSDEAPCDEWDQQVKDHPDTVLINTIDNTLVEAYFRTGIDALGAYVTLGRDFVVPNPDPEWPADSLVLIDPRTGEVLLVERFEDIVGFDVTTGKAEYEDAEPE